jgi:hypothetical protein
MMLFQSSTAALKSVGSSKDKVTVADAPAKTDFAEGKAPIIEEPSEEILQEDATIEERFQAQSLLKLVKEDVLSV